MHLRQGHAPEACVDIDRAADLGPLGTRGHAIRFLARHPALAPGVLAVLGRTGVISSRA
jgi:hypothetical protein